MTPLKDLTIGDRKNSEFDLNPAKRDSIGMIFKQKSKDNIFNKELTIHSDLPNKCCYEPEILTVRNKFKSPIIYETIKTNLKYNDWLKIVLESPNMHKAYLQTI